MGKGDYHHAYDYDLFKFLLVKFEDAVVDYLLFCDQGGVILPRPKDFYEKKNYPFIKKKSLNKVNAFLGAVRFWRLITPIERYKGYGFRLYFNAQLDGSDYFSSIRSITLHVTESPTIFQFYRQTIETFPMGKPDVYVRNNRQNYSNKQIKDEESKNQPQQQQQPQLPEEQPPYLPMNKFDKIKDNIW